MKYFCLLSILLSSWAQALTLDDLQQQFADQALVRAHFEQTRSIKGLSQALRSRGNMLVDRTHGILWDQTAPFPMQLTLTTTKMVMRVNGQPAEVLTAKNQPQMFQFNHLLRSLLEADHAALAKHFSMHLNSQSDGHWTLQLTPTTSPLNKIFRRIEMTGQHYLQSVTLLDQQQDTTHIQFSQQRQTPSTLTDTERQRFVAH